MHILKCTHFPGTSRAILIQRRCYFRSPCYYEYIAKSTFCFCRHHVLLEKAVRCKMYIYVKRVAIIAMKDSFLAFRTKHEFCFRIL